MPELPEVETVRRVLASFLINKTIQRVTVRLPRIIQGLTPEEFSRRLQGLTLTSIERKGKYLLFQLPPYTLVSHLRMEGKYRLLKAEENWEKHDHVEFRFTDGSALRYNDVRQFGTMHVVPQNDFHSIRGLATLGPEPIAEDFNGSVLKNRLESAQNSAVKAALLQQNRVAGLGNIYADEALFQAGIHPARKVRTLRRWEYDTLADACRQVLLAGIAAGGATVRTYRSPQAAGSFQLQIQVYGKKGEPCPRCGHPIERIVVGGRGTHCCPLCQPRRGQRKKERGTES